ncbi:hypothetical protein ACF0H5_003401 [Mactra antiquata]
MSSDESYSVKMKNGSATSVRNASSARSAASDDSLLNCDVHTNEEMTVLCREHDMMLCSKCVFEQHSACTKLESLRSACSHAPKKDDLKKFGKDLKDMKQKLIKQKKNYEDEMKRLKEETVKAEKEVGDFRKLIDWVLDRMERKGKEYIKKRYESLNKALIEEVSRCEEMLAQLDSLTVHNKATNDTDPIELCVKVNKGYQVISRSRQLYSKLKSNNHREIVKFTVDPKVESFARGLSWYGKDKTYLSCEPPITFPHLYQVKGQNQFDIRAKGDKHVCSIVSMCQVDDGTMLLADAANCCIKQVDVLYRIVDTLQLPGEPNAVCYVDKGMAAVLLKDGSGSIVQFLCLENKLHHLKQFSIPKLCQEIESHSSFLYVLCDGLILVYTTECEISKTFDIGKPVQHISVCVDNGSIYATTKNGFVVINKDGAIGNEVVGDSVETVYCVTMDTNNQLFLSNYETHCVVQYNHDLQTLGSVVSQNMGIKNPQAVVFDRLHCRLVVAMKFKNIIKVFDLK